MKKSTGLLKMGFFLALAAILWHCTNNTPTTLTNPNNCPNPNPTISVDEDGAYIIKTDSVPNAASVVIYGSNAKGQPIDTVTLPVGGAHAYFFADSLYPVQLRFQYRSSSDSIVANDNLQLGNIEINSGGIAAMDVVMGLTAPNPAPSAPPSCPSTTLIATGTGEVVFSWANNNWFDVSITQGASVKKIGIQTKDGPSGHPGFVNVYRTDIYPCLDNPACRVFNNSQTCKIPIVTTDSCVLTGYQDGTIREVKLACPGCSFVVKKK